MDAPYARDRRTVASIVQESAKKELREAKMLGLGLTMFFMLLWMGTMFLWSKYPWLLFGLENLRRMVCE